MKMKSIEERLAVVKSTSSYNRVFTKPLKPGTCKNRVIEKSCTGYTFQIDNLSYRGIWVSTLEDIELTVDGVKVPKSDMLFKVHGLNIPIEEMVHHSYVFWWAKDQAIVSVNRVGGLPKGDHKFELIIKKRQDFGHSYDDGPGAYDRAVEFHKPQTIIDECVYTIE
jgi:hypothetical protein